MAYFEQNHYKPLKIYSPWFIWSTGMSYLIVEKQVHQAFGYLMTILSWKSHTSLKMRLFYNSVVNKICWPLLYGHKNRFFFPGWKFLICTIFGFNKQNSTYMLHDTFFILLNMIIVTRIGTPRYRLSFCKDSSDNYTHHQ